ncbi:MAG TPA: SGNH/GDSL hydrolase family protein [Steroidobacteraceae bacterium]|nr:SGNH/GDSL hydrolase family protein [Steroidobacteraceae bacterium]
MQPGVSRRGVGTTVALLALASMAAADTELERLRSDWAQLQYYRDQDRRLPPPGAARPRVIFLGDSLTESWNLSALALDKVEVLNRGIGGQTTPQMLVRFRQDVVDLKPAVVHILAGTNDLAGNTGPTTPEAIENNLSSMVEIAAANHVRVVLASVLPALDYPWRPGLEPAPRIVALNDWIRAYASRRQLVYADYYSALVDARGGFKPELADDGVHPNGAGYAVMSPIARQSIRQALAAR